MRRLPLLLVLLLPLLARAGDEPPLRPFERTTASLPAPREAAAFDVRGRVEVEGRTVGTASRTTGGAGKSGSPTARSITSRPAARNSCIRIVNFSVPDGIIL